MQRVPFIVIAILCAATARADELRMDAVRQSLTGTHTHYQQYINGIPVIGGERIETPTGVHENLARRGFSHVESAIATAHDGELVYVNVDGIARLAIRQRSSGLKPVATFFDASTGEILMVRRSWYDVAARVFAVNPVAKLNDPSLRDANDSAVPDTAYSIVDLLDLAPNGPLTGPNVRIVDTDAPFTTRAEASQSLLFTRSQPQFEEVNAYFHIDRSQRYLQSLGFVGPKRVVGYAIPVDAHAVSGTDNSFYASGDVRGQGELFFGDGGTDDAEDSDITLHEFAHAIHDWIAPDAFNGSSASEGRALAEGFGDYWGFSQNYVDTAASGRDPFCIGDWDARCFGDNTSERCGYPPGSDCLRRVDSTTTMDDFLRVDSAGFEHRNGGIWSSALREIFTSLVARYGVEQGRRAVDTIVIESLFGAPVNTTYAGQARKILAADSALSGGANRTAICRAMLERHILSLEECGAQPRGEWTLYQSSTSTIHVDDIRAIDDINVRVDATGRISLVAPDGVTRLLATALGGAVTFGIDAVPSSSLDPLRGQAAAGDWRLIVEGGQLRSWSLVIRFAGVQPLSVRPTTTQIAKHIPVAGHLTGAAGTQFRSDVRIFNRSNLAAQIVAIFTPTGVSGIRQFSAVNLAMAPQQTMVLDDIVQTVFLASGLGHIDLIGDIDRVLVTSRAYASGSTGTLGDSVPVVDTFEAGADEIAPLTNTIDFRSNVGAAEVLGGAGVVRFAYFDRNGAPLGSDDVPIAPFGHVQIRVNVAGEGLRVHVSIASGNPRFVAYGSVVNNRQGDSYTIAAARLPQPAGEVALPMTGASLITLSHWISQAWQVTLARTTQALSDLPLARPVVFLRSDGSIFNVRSVFFPLQTGLFATPLVPPVASVQHVVGLEQNARFSSEVNVVNFGDETVSCSAVVYDAAGIEVARRDLTVAPKSLRAVVLAGIVAGEIARVEVRGAVAAYGVLTDRATSDSSYIRGQY